MQGIILLNKPAGITSNTACNKVKKLINASKAGHLGTLDPMGTGLLPITIGKATRIFDYFLSKDKVYESTFMFGVLTDTLDFTGTILKEENVEITKEDVLKILPDFKGKQSQMPPDFSAKKINGKKAYELARCGEEVNLKPKEIEIYDLKLISQTGKNQFRFLFHVSSGTYIRSIARDMGLKLSTYCIMTDIKRTKCGNFDLKNAFDFEQIENGHYQLIKSEDVFQLPKIFIDEDKSNKIKNGVEVNFSYKNGEYKLYNSQEFLGVIKLEFGKIVNFIKLWE